MFCMWLSKIKDPYLLCVRQAFRKVDRSLPIYCNCHSVFCSRLQQPRGPKMAQVFPLLLFPIRFKNLVVLPSPPPRPFSSTPSLHSQKECCIKSGPTIATKTEQKQKDQTRLSYLPWTYNAPAYLTQPLNSTQPLPPCQGRNAEGQWPFYPTIPPWFLRKIRRWKRNWEGPIDGSCISQLKGVWVL